MKIKQLKLDCANLDEQRYFYTKKFKFAIVEESEGSFTIEMGSSLLTFVENRLKKPYYHFALNVPFGALEKALNWVKKKVEVISTDDGEIQDFRAWNARAIYFLDPAGNIVELIGRKNFNKSAGSSFSENKILNISEVGLPVFEVSSTYKSLKKACGIKKFDCRSNIFCATGDDEGLFIIVDKSEKTWFPTNSPAKAFNLEVHFEEAEELYCLNYYQGDLNIDKMKKQEA